MYKGSGSIDSVSLPHKVPMKYTGFYSCNVERSSGFAAEICLHCCHLYVLPAEGAI